MLFQARTLERLQAEAGSRPGARSLLQGLDRHAERVGVAGEPETDPAASILFRLRPGPPWEPTNRVELLDALHGGALEAPFVTSLGSFLADRGEETRAIEMLRLSLRWDPKPSRTWQVLGSALLRSGNPSGAAEALEEALRREPRSSEARLLLGMALRERGIAGRAVIELAKLVRDHPTYAEAHLELARAAAQERQWPLVVRSLEAYLALEPQTARRAALLEALEQARRELREGR
jgi:tetratricopeptide (TPR) repeat protein